MAATPTKPIRLSIYCPLRPSVLNGTSSPVQEPEQVDVTPGSTVMELKRRLEGLIDGTPLVEGQTLIWRGRRLKNDESLGEVVRQAAAEPVDAEMGYALHLSVLPSYWKAPNPLTDRANPEARAAAERIAALSAKFNGYTQPSPSAFPPAASSGRSSSPSTFQATPPEQQILPGPSGGLSTAPAAPLEPEAIQKAIDDVIGGSSIPGTPIPSVSTPLHLPPPAATTSAATSASLPNSLPSWKTYMTHLTSLSTSQKVEFIGHLSNSERYYATVLRVLQDRSTVQIVGLSPPLKHEEIEDYMGPVGKEMEQRTEQLLKALEMDHIVRSAEERAKKEVEGMVETQKGLLGEGTSSQVISIGGYPFLLHVPAQYALPFEKRLEAHAQLKRYHTVHVLLTSMLNIARTTNVSSVVHQSSLPSRRSGSSRSAEAGGPAGPPAPIAAGQRGGVGALGALGLGARAAQQLAGPGFPAARVALVINLDEIIALMVPLAFLAVKLGFLIYIFGRHASYTKRAVMISLATAWVIWEGIAIRRRRRNLEARRGVVPPPLRPQPHQAQAQAQPASQGPPLDQAQQQQRDQARRHAQVLAQFPEVARLQLQAGRAVTGAQAGGSGGDGNAAGVAVGDNAAAQVVNRPLEDLPPIMAQIRDRLEREERRQARRAARDDAVAQQANAGAVVPGGSASSSSARTGRAPLSKLTPRYWMQLIAKIGLQAEAREMGLSRSLPPLTNSSPDVIRPAPRLPLTPRRFFRNLMICIVLFFGTLVPEIERLRKKAIEKRQRKLTELQEAREALAAEREQLVRRMLENKPAGSASVAATTQAGGVQAGIDNSEERSIQPQQASSTDMTVATSHSSIENDNEDHSIGTSTAVPSQRMSSDSTRRRNAQISSDTDGDASAEVDGEGEGEGDGALFDPPFDEATLRAALGEAGSATANGHRRSGSQINDNSATSGLPSISIDTSSNNDRTNNASFGNGTSTSIGLNDSTSESRLNLPPASPNVSGDLDDSAPPTPSAIDLEEDENEGENNQEEEVGMILF